MISRMKKTCTDLPIHVHQGLGFRLRLQLYILRVFGVLPMAPSVGNIGTINIGTNGTIGITILTICTN